MLIKGQDGSEFSLVVEGYEFPESRDSKYDANWLMVSISVKAPQGAWSARGPYLLQWEAEQLATWMEGMTKGGPFGEHINFCEPNIGFGISGKRPDLLTLRVDLNAEFRPPGSERRPSRLVDEGTSVEFRLSSQDLLSAARALRSELASFPRRKAREES